MYEYTMLMGTHVIILRPLLFEHWQRPIRPVGSPPSYMGHYMNQWFS